MKRQEFKNILVARTDRIGDVILTLPLIEAIKRNFPSSQVTMLVNSYTAQLVEANAKLILYADGNGILKPFFEILKELRQANLDVAIIAYPRFRIALLLWLAGIPLRVGTGYRWYSFLFNKRVYEHRRTVEKHEAEYNVSLLSVLGCTELNEIKANIVITEKEKDVALKVREEIGVPSDAKLIILHPGSGGSAYDWKLNKFAKLAKELEKRNYFVVVTGTQKEEKIIRDVVGNSGRNVRPFISNISLREFAAFVQTANLLVANSTGPLHLAAVVGTPVIGFYPPVPVMSPKRWGPLTEKKIIFVPDPQKFLTSRKDKLNPDCMDQIEVGEVVEAVDKLVKTN